MKFTARTLLVMNYAVSFNDNDDMVYMEYRQLKKVLSRPEMILLVKALSRPKYDKVTGRSNWYLSGLDHGPISQVIAI